MLDIRFCRYVGPNMAIRQILSASAQLPIAIVDGDAVLLVVDAQNEIPVPYQDVILSPVTRKVCPMELAASAGSIKVTQLPKPLLQSVSTILLLRWAEDKSLEELLETCEIAGFTEKEVHAAYYWHQEMTEAGEDNWGGDTIERCWETALQKAH